MMFDALMLAIPYPEFDPIALEIGPFALRWYALAYITGLVLGWYYVRKLAESSPAVCSKDDVDDFLTWATLGVILGGRIGYVLFYKPEFYASDPLAIFKVWQGGMAFHGGFLGVVVAGLIFVRRRGIPALAFGDMIACAAPIGLFFGRIANFVNGELYGRVTDSKWGMVFPNGGPDPRHPSQLYEAGLEGALLFVILFILWRIPFARSKPGTLIGVFVAGYGASRMIVEFFRQPDAHLGFVAGSATMGQMLSIPMVLIGLGLVFYAQTRKPDAQ